MAKHNAGQGAKYTRGRLPVKCVWSESAKTQGAALRREAEVKGWSKQKKEDRLRAV